MQGLFTELSIPFEAHDLSKDQIVRRLELVRQNIGLIAPFRPESYKLVLYAGNEKSPKPLLLMLLPDKCFVYSELNPEKLQSAINNWYTSHDPETLNRLLDRIDHPSWTFLSSSQFYPKD
jgi:hypothetical protein